MRNTTGARRAKNGLWQDGRGVYHLDLSIQGAPRIRRSTGTTDKAAAQEYRDRIKSDLWRQVRLGEKPRVNWQDAKDAFVEDCERRKLASVADYQDKFDWLSTRFDDLELGEITKANIEDALKAKFSEGVAGATVNRYYAAISSVLHFAKRKEWIDGFPTLVRDDLYPENDGRFRWLSYEESDRLLEGQRLTNLQHRMIRCSLATGLRQSNVTHLEKCDVDLSRRTAWAWPYQTKNGKRFQIPLNDEAIAAIEEGWDDDERFVFVAPNAKAGGRPTIMRYPCNSAWYATLREEKINDFTWHDLRHTWASRHVMNGTPLEVLQKLGGWSDFDMVLRYAHLSTSYIHGFAGNSSIRGKNPSIEKVAGSDIVPYPADSIGRRPGTRTPNQRIKSKHG